MLNPTLPITVCCRMPSSWCTEICGNWLESPRCETAPDNWHERNENRFNGPVA